MKALGAKAVDMIDIGTMMLLPVLRVQHESGESVGLHQKRI